jgi:peptide/nickel transport system ATP-binding protein
MAVIERMSHEVAVMRGGEFVEYGTRRQVFENPVEDYTKALMRAVPVPVPRRGASDVRTGAATDMIHLERDLL